LTEEKKTLSEELNQLKNVHDTLSNNEETLLKYEVKKYIK
jgi:hypothetical protein